MIYKTERLHEIINVCTVSLYVCYLGKNHIIYQKIKFIIISYYLSNPIIFY